MGHPIRDHLIEEILLNAHTHREMGVDLIEEYFLAESSLDYITAYAQKMLKGNSDPQLEKIILQNLSECIVVKAQKDCYTLTGMARNFFVKLGLPLKRSSEILRAEQLLLSSKKEKV